MTVQEEHVMNDQRTLHERIRAGRDSFNLFTCSIGRRGSPVKDDVHRSFAPSTKCTRELGTAMETKLTDKFEEYVRIGETTVN